MQYTVLDPCISEEQSVSICLLVFECAVDESVAYTLTPALKHLVA